MTSYSVHKAMRAQQIERESAGDEELSSVRKAVESGDWSGLLKGYQNVKDELSVVVKVILRGTRIVMPPSLRSQTLTLVHRGHQGIVKKKRSLREVMVTWH